MAKVHLVWESLQESQLPLATQGNSPETSQLIAGAASSLPLSAEDLRMKKEIWSSA